MPELEVHEASVHFRKGFTLLIVGAALVPLALLVRALLPAAGIDELLTMFPVVIAAAVMLGGIGLVLLAQGVVDHARNAELRTEAALRVLQAQRPRGEGF